MSVKITRWKSKSKKDASGRAVIEEAFMVSVTMRLADGSTKLIRKVSPVQTKRGAELYEQQLRMALLNGTYREEMEDVPTVSEFKKRFIDGYAKANQQKPSTIVGKEKIFETYLEPKFGTKRLDELKEADVQSLKADLQMLSPKTVNNVLCTLNTMLKQAVAWEVIEEKPTIKLLKAPKPEVGFYEPEDYARLVTTARNLAPRIELMVLLGGDAGLRCGEIMALEWQDLDFKRGVVKVQRSAWSGRVTVPKSGRTRQVKPTARLASALVAHRHLRGARVLCRDGRGSASN